MPAVFTLKSLLKSSRENNMDYNEIPLGTPG
jgi:hypothetical protein